MRIFRRTAPVGSCIGAFLLLMLYVIGMWSWHADLNRQKAIRELRDKVVTCLARQPAGPKTFSWDELAEAGAVNADDARFLQKHGYEYQPIGPDSSPHSIFLLQREDANYEHYVYQDGSYGYLRKWPSPDGRLTLVDFRGEGKATSRTIRIIADNGKALGDFLIDGYERPVLWNETGTYVAMNAPLAGSEQPLTIWRVTGKEAAVVPLPPDLNLSSLLARETPHQNAQLGMDFIEAQSWQGPSSLMLFAQGAGSYVHPQTGKKMGFNLIDYVLLETGPQDQCRIKSVKRKHFAASEFH